MLDIVILLIFCVLTNVYASKVSRYIPSVILSNGIAMPKIGVSTWTGFSSQLESASDIKPASPLLEKRLQQAIDTGYRLFDASACEGDNERVLGSVISSRIEDHYITREDFFISTKLSSYSHKKHQVVPELQESLNRLQLEYVDLYMIHLPFALLTANRVDDSIDYLETWLGVEDALRLNLTRSVGVAHVDLHMLDKLLHTEVKPHVLQIEVNLNLQQPELLELCSLHNITVIAVNPHGSLYSTERDVKSAPLPRWDDPVLAGFGNKYGKTVPQIALRFLVERDVIPLILPQSNYQLQENIDIFNFKLEPFETFLLKSFHNGFRTLDFKYWSHSKYYPFNVNTALEVKERLHPGYYNVKLPLPIYYVTEKSSQEPPIDF